MKQIIEKLASKELSFGCFVQIPNSPHPKDIEKITEISFRKEDGKTIYGCTNYVITNFTEEDFKVLGRSIYIGNVLEAVHKKTECYDQDIIDLWKPCGLSRSLQQIEEGSGYEDYLFPHSYPTELKVAEEKEAFDLPKHIHYLPRTKTLVSLEKKQRLKDPNARALETFLTSIL